MKTFTTILDSNLLPNLVTSASYVQHLSALSAAHQMPFMKDGIRYLSQAHFDLVQQVARRGNMLAFGQLLQARTWEDCCRIMECATPQSPVVGENSSAAAPSVSVTVKRIEVAVNRTGRKKKVFGVEFTVNGKSFPLYFGSKEQTLLYVGVLLRQKENRYLDRNEFKYSLNTLVYPHGRSLDDALAKKASLEWIESLYRLLFPAAAANFGDWYEHLREDSCHAISHAKSQINTKIKSVLKGLPQEVIDLLLVQKERRGATQSIYRMSLSPKQICMEDGLERLIS